MRLLEKLFGAFAKPRPVTLAATVARSSLRPNGQPQASVEIENGVTALVLTETKLSKGDQVKVRLAACGWEIAG